VQFDSHRATDVVTNPLEVSSARIVQTAQAVEPATSNRNTHRPLLSADRLSHSQPKQQDSENACLLRHRLVSFAMPPNGTRRRRLRGSATPRLAAIEAALTLSFLYT
jgi:hypothetical protein